MMYRTRAQLHTRAGYSLVEVLVAIAVLMLAIIGPITIAAQGIKAAQFSREQTVAYFLAQEGLEIFFALRASAGLAYIDGQSTNSFPWSNLDALDPGCDTSSQCVLGIDFRDNTLDNNLVYCGGSDVSNCQLYFDDTNPARAAYSHDSSLGDVSPYQRTISIIQIGSNSHMRRLRSLVSWDSIAYPNQRQSVELVTDLYNIYDFY